MAVRAPDGQPVQWGDRDAIPEQTRVSVLGPMLIDGDGSWQLRDRTVLGVLVVRAPAMVTVDEIAFALWADQVPPSCRKVIQGSVVRLRRSLGQEAICTVDRGYRLGLEASAIDGTVFELAVGSARDELAAGFADRAARTVRAALKLWRGDPLPELEGWAPAEAEARRLVGLREAAEELLLESRLRAGRVEGLTADAEQLVAETPYREERWMLWARILYAAGRQVEALAVLRQLGDTLRDELGIDPNPDVGALELAILQQDPALYVPVAVAHGSVCPWRGLLPYEPMDAGSFFGRDADVDAVCEQLRSVRGVVVAGRSGVGKSSFLRAGVAPRLVAQGDEVFIITPGSNPIDALADVPDGAILVVDQTEEIIIQCNDRDQRRAFFDAVSRRSGRVLLATRADLLDELAEDSTVAALLAGGLFVLRPLDDHGLRAVIEGPAAKAELRLEPGLVDVLLEECDGQPGVLPLLSHALVETWRRAEGNTLTVGGYRASGGIRAAIATSAEHTHEQLDEQQRVQMRRLFRRLVRFDGDEPSRVRVPRGIVDGEVVETLLSSRLIVACDDGSLQIAHEQLARHWPRLRDWVVEDRDGARVLRHLADEARAWDHAGRSADLLYRGVRLAAASEWAAEHVEELDEVERQFVDESLRGAQAELRQARRENARLRAVLAFSAVLLVASVVMTGLALHQRGVARNARDTAQISRDVSESLRIGAEADAAHDPSVALTLVAESLSTDDSEAARAQALEVFGRFRALMSTGQPPPDTDWPVGVADSAGGETATSPDGLLRAQAMPRSIRITDTATGSVVGTIDSLPTRPNALAFDATGRMLAAGFSEAGFADAGTTTVWNVAHGAEVGRMDAGEGEVWSHRFAADGRSIYSFGADGLHQWDLTGARAIVRTGTGAPISFRAGDVLMSMSDDSVEAWIAEACRLAGRSLTPEEWYANLGDVPYDPVC